MVDVHFLIILVFILSLSAPYLFDEFACLLRLRIRYLSATIFYHDVACREQRATHRTRHDYLIDAYRHALAQSATHDDEVTVSSECVSGVHQAVDTCRPKQQTHETQRRSNTAAHKKTPQSYYCQQHYRGNALQTDVMMECSVHFINNIVDYPNKSEWVPVSTKININSVSYCSQTSNQSGLIWHSQHSLYLPFNLWGRYSGGRLPHSARIDNTFRKSSCLQPLFKHFLKDFLKRFEYLTVYFISSNYP